MRKVIIVMVAFILAFASVIPVYAGTTMGSGSSHVSAVVSNQFSVKIPSEISIHGDKTTSTVTIMDAKLGENKKVSVYCSNCKDSGGITLTYSTGTNSSLDRRVTCKIKNLELNQYVGSGIPICTFEESDLVNKTAEKDFELEVMSDVETFSATYEGYLLYTFDVGDK